MISIKMLSGGAAKASYYVEKAADCHPSGYYTGDQEPVGRWCGAGAATLGLAGPVTGAQTAVFSGLLDGRLPDGTAVAAPVLRQDPNGPDGARLDVRRCGIDLTVSAPKSVSVLWALGDSATAATILAAHQAAVADAVGYLDRHASHGLRGHQGGHQRAARVGTDGLIAAAFDHHTSRADDPQLHTHVVVTNLVRGVDGKWSAVDSRAMHRHARTAGCIYQATLRGQLTRTLGVSWGPVRRGTAEITGITKALRIQFSTRRHAIEDELDRTGGAGRRAAQRAAYVTRPAKTHTPEQPLRQQWAARATHIGHPAEFVLASTLQQTVSPSWPALESVAVDLFGADGLTHSTTSFDRRDLIQALTETLPAGTAVTGRQLEAAADQLLDHDDAVALLKPATRDGDRRWSTRSLLAAEHQALTISSRPSALPAISRRDASATAAETTLSPQQKQVVVGLLTSPFLVDVVVGPAGSGKTAALRTAADAWRHQDIPVLGAALAAITARRLEAATHVPCTSIARLIADLDRTDPATGQPAGLAPHSVVLVDEASMIGTRHATRLLAHVARAGGKLVLVGDPAQLSEIEAGGLFAALAARHRPLSLTGNQRQTSEWERDALTALRDGRADTAIASYLDHDRIHLAPTPHATRDQLAADYLAHRAQHDDPYVVIALASSRRDVDALNAAIRRHLRTAAQLGPDTATVTGENDSRSYAVGDIVLVTRNDHQAGLLNGTRATLVAADHHHLTLHTETGDQVTVPTGWADEHLDHGYALTVHKAQGLTSAVGLLYGTSTLCQQAGYVALSRGRDANHLYASHLSLISQDAAYTNLGADDIGPNPAEVIHALTKYLTNNRRHTLARHQAPQLRDSRDDQLHRQHEPDRVDTGRGR